LRLRVAEDAAGLAASAAREFAARAARAVRERGRFAVALAGGSTPRAAYELLAREHASEVDWRRVHFFFGDERPVPPDHPDSNYRMAQEALLSRVPAGSVHRMRGELAPGEAARRYEEELRSFFAGEKVPRFDLILLGLGEDGHTASLFPHTEALDETARLVAANPVPKLGVTRITLTLPVINAARAVVFLVSGESKAEALRAVLEGPADSRSYPASLVQPGSGELLWLADRPAATLFNRG
jgi:6-phosphogluconolactonase